MFSCLLLIPRLARLSPDRVGLLACLRTYRIVQACRLLYYWSQHTCHSDKNDATCVSQRLKDDHNLKPGYVMVRPVV